jgi:hypothetical protein
MWAAGLGMGRWAVAVGRDHDCRGKPASEGSRLIHGPAVAGPGPGAGRPVPPPAAARAAACEDGPGRL